MSKQLLSLLFAFSFATSFAQDGIRKDFKIYYDRGKEVSYYSDGDLLITANMYVQRMYGKYYFVSIFIQNKSDHPIDLLSKNLWAKLKQGDVVGDVDVLYYSEYSRKVANKQGWNSFLNAWGEYGAANKAGGYSSSSNVYNSNGYVGTVNTYGNNNANTYAARQNATNNVNNYNANQDNIKYQIANTYLQDNTIFPGQSYSGFVVIRYIKCDIVRLYLNINNQTYRFVWNP